MTIMGRYTRRGGGAWPVLSGILAATVCLPAAGQWPGWGGPTRDFKVDAGNLASRWPDEGPKRIWTRDLGDGLSSIAVDDGRLFTMYRKGREEVVVSLDAKTGDTVWEHKYGISKVKGISDEFGKGPQSTPLVHGGRVYTLGKTGRVHCLDKQTGKPFWSHDLVEAFQVKPPYFGFASSPIAYKNNLIVVAGGKGSGLMAFDLADGTLRWKKLDLKNTYSSPILINVDGEDQIVVLSNREIVGVAAVSGELRWRHPHENQWKTNICTPLMGRDGRLYVTASGEAGSRVLTLHRKGDRTEVTEVWANRKMGVGQNNVVRVGDHLYGCSGGDSSSFMTAIDAKTGKIAWKERGFAKTNLLHADGKFILLDEDGVLSLATATPKAIKVVSKVSLLKKKAWTVPTLVGHTLFVRDKKRIMALNLGADAS